MHVNNSEHNLVCRDQRNAPKGFVVKQNMPVVEHSDAAREALKRDQLVQIGLSNLSGGT